MNAQELWTEFTPPRQHRPPSHKHQAYFKCRSNTVGHASRSLRQRLHFRHAQANSTVPPITTARPSRQARYVQRPAPISLMFIPKTLATSVRGKYTTTTSANKFARSARRADTSDSWRVAAPITRRTSSLSSRWSVWRVAVAFLSVSDHGELSPEVELDASDGVALGYTLR